MAAFANSEGRAIFDNRIEIISPGHLPNNLTVEKIRTGNSNIRNPILDSGFDPEFRFARRSIHVNVHPALFPGEDEKPVIPVIENSRTPLQRP